MSLLRNSKLILLLLAGSAFAAPHASVFAETPAANPAPPAVLIPTMHKAFAAFRDLQKFMVSRDRFADPKNADQISTLIGTLRTSFHSAEDKNLTISDEPGFKSTLAVINDLLADAKTRFDEGKKGYALWRLKTAANHCVSCHTRHEVPMEFSDEGAGLEDLSLQERGEFFLATRQFDRAKEAFKAAALSPEGEATRMDALRNWLLVYTRVKPNPDEALTELTKMIAHIPLRNYDKEEVQSWIVSLRRWKSENRAIEIPVLTKAENLMRQAVGAGDPLNTRTGTVELLRATGMLHTLLEGKGALSSGERSYALYLLGLAYSELPFFFITELPEMFLEQAIRESPNSETAQKAFRRYREVVTLGFTGSGGTRIPDDVLLKFKELHDLAYGAVTMKGQV